jgi:hypothetical protein
MEKVALMSNTTDIQIDESITVAHVLSWRAILAGVAVAIVVQLLLSLLGGAIGLAVINPASADKVDTATVGVVAAIWWTLSGILAAWVGGMTAGRLCAFPASETAAWHGLVTWAVATLLVFFLLATSVGGLIGGAFSVLGTVAGAAGQAATATPQLAAAADPFSDIGVSLNDALGVRDPEAARAAVTSFVRSALSADEASSQDAMNRATDALGRATGSTPEEARQRLTEWKAQYDQAVESAQKQATDAANAARKVASSAGILSVIALLFGAAAGWFGGRYSPVPGSQVQIERFAGRFAGRQS